MASRRSSQERREPAATIEQLVGPLEAACLRALWAQAPATVEDVRSRVNAAEDSELAYTTVMTVLSRLHEKGLAERERRGRAYRYQPSYSERELVAVLTRREVDELVDRYGQVALAQFAATLQRTDPELLQQVVELASQEDDDE